MDELLKEFAPIAEGPEPERGPVIPGVAEHLAKLLRLGVQAEGHVDVWCRMVHGYHDLKIEELDVDSIGNSPTWTDFLDSRLTESVVEGYATELVDGCEVRRSGLEWAIHHGVAPGQPFLVRVYATEGSKTWTDCGYEYDSWNDWEILHVTPWPAARSARAWAKFLADRRDDARRAHADQQRRWEAAQLDTQNLVLWSASYFGPHQRCHDDMEMPNGWTLTLVWEKDQRSEMLAQGRSDRGDQAEAEQDLVAACARLPFLAIGPAEILKRPRRRWR